MWVRVLIIECLCATIVVRMTPLGVKGVSYIHRCRKGRGRGGGGGGGGKCPPTFINGGASPPTFLELYINCRMIAPNCCPGPVT